MYSSEISLKIFSTYDSIDKDKKGKIRCISVHVSHSASLHVKPEDDDFSGNTEGIYLGKSSTAALIYIKSEKVKKGKDNLSDFVIQCCCYIMFYRRVH